MTVIKMKDDAKTRTEDFNSRSLATTDWAFAKADLAISLLQNFSSQHLANTVIFALIVSAVTSVGHASPEFFDAVAESATSSPLDAITEVATRGGLKYFNSQQLASTAWAFAAVGHALPELFDPIANMAMVVWAFAEAGRATPVLFDAFSSRLKNFISQDLAHEWAFVMDSHARLLARMCFCNEYFGSQSLAHTPRAFTKLGHASPEPLGCFLGMISVLNNLRTQYVLFWACTTASHTTPVLYDAISEAAKTRIKDFTSPDLANTVWALATVGHTSAASLDMIAEMAMDRSKYFSLQSLAHTAWVYAQIGYASPEFFGSICRMISILNSLRTPYGPLRAFATVSHTSPVPLDAISEAVKHFNSQAL